MNRLFAFGCSFTNYHWPTWADIIAPNFDEYQNWARIGAGNNFILNSLIECDLKNNFTEDDTVIVVFTLNARVDYYNINDWGFSNNHFHGRDGIAEPYSCPKGYQLLNYAWLASAITFLDSKRVKYKLFSLDTFDTSDPVFVLYQKYLNQISSTTDKWPGRHNKYPKIKFGDIDPSLLYQRLKGDSWPPLDVILNGTYKDLELSSEIMQELKEFNQQLAPTKNMFSFFKKKEYDGHPGPIQHLKWVQTFLPEYPISQDTNDWITSIENALINGQDYNFRYKIIDRF